MPRIKPTLPPPTVPWTKVPNVVLDHIMSRIKDTELRVLLVILRQTLGWNQEAKTVTLPYKTLMKRTGRGSEAISLAIRALHRQGLIHTSYRKPPRMVRISDEHHRKTEQQQ